jgi:hypothetical protein
LRPSAAGVQPRPCDNSGSRRGRKDGVAKRGGQTVSGRCALQPWLKAPVAPRTGGPALRLAGLRPLARSICHAAPRHREPPRCATRKGLTPSLRLAVGVAYVRTQAECLSFEDVSGRRFRPVGQGRIPRLHQSPWFRHERGGPAEPKQAEASRNQGGQAVVRGQSPPFRLRSSRGPADTDAKRTI